MDSMIKITNMLKVNIEYGFKINKPILLLRILGNYIKVMFKQYPLRYVDIALDYTCNLSCQHCFRVTLEDKNKDKVSLEEYSRFAHEAMKIGCINFGFQGGEVFLLPNLEEIIKVFEPNKNLISIITNGTLVNYERLKNLKKEGLNQLIISLDSADSEKHDKFRGADGTYEKAYNALLLAKKMGLKVSVNTTISKYNLYSEDVHALIKLCTELNIIFHLCLASPTGNWQNKMEYIIDDEDRKFIKKLQIKNPLVRRDMDANYLRWGCSAANEVLYITPYGDVLPCPFLHFSIGNIKKESISKIRSNFLKKNPLYSRYHNKCLACEDKDYILKILQNENPIN